MRKLKTYQKVLVVVFGVPLGLGLIVNGVKFLDHPKAYVKQQQAQGAAQAKAQAQQQAQSDKEAEVQARKQKIAMAAALKHEQQEVAAAVKADTDNFANVLSFTQVAGREVKSDSPATAYNNISQAITHVESEVTFFINSEQKPSDLPRKVSGYLNSAAMQYASAENSYKDGLNDALKYLDDNKPSQIAAMQTAFQTGQTCAGNAEAQLAQAKKAVSLK